MPFLVGVGAFFKKISFEVWVIIAIVGAAVLGIYTVDRNAVKRTNAKNDKKDLERTIELQEESKDIVDEIETRIEHTEIAVARQPQFRSTDSLRKTDPELAALILDDPAGHER